jgi:hypothetical protein
MVNRKTSVIKLDVDCKSSFICEFPDSRPDFDWLGR